MPYLFYNNYPIQGCNSTCPEGYRPYSDYSSYLYCDECSYITNHFYNDADDKCQRCPSKCASCSNFSNCSTCVKLYSYFYSYSYQYYSYFPMHE